MEELQSLAQRCNQAPPPPAQPPIDLSAGGSGANLEAALDGLDIDGLLAQIERDHAAGNGNGTNGGA